MFRKIICCTMKTLREFHRKSNILFQSWEWKRRSAYHYKLMETLKRQSNHKKFNILWYYAHLNWCQLFNFTFWSMVFDPILLVYALSIKCYTLARKNRSLELWNINKHIKNGKNMKKNGKMEIWKYTSVQVSPPRLGKFFIYFLCSTFSLSSP